MNPRCRISKVRLKPSNVVPLKPDKAAPAVVLLTALNDDLQSVLIIGERPDGSLYADMSEADGPQALWLMSRVWFRTLSAAHAADPGDAIA